MDCANGKEAAVENQEANVVQETSGIIIDRQEFKDLGKFVEKSDMVEKVICIILKVAVIAYVWILGWKLLMDVAHIMNEGAGAMLLVMDAAGTTFWFCIIMFVVLKICGFVLKMKLSLCGTVYMAPVQKWDTQSLIGALRQMNCPAVRDIYVDPDGNVCVQGERYRYKFEEEDNLLMVSPDKEDYRAFMEQMLITGSLLKFLAPDAPVNIYKNHKMNVSLPKKKRRAVITAIICGVVWLALAANPDALNGGQKYINMVKSGCPMLYPDSTYEEAFESFFKDCRWEYFKSTDDLDVVEFYGKCLYGGEEADITVQFVVSQEEGTFELYALLIDDEVQPELLKVSFVLDIFDDYEAER